MVVIIVHSEQLHQYSHVTVCLHTELIHLMVCNLRCPSFQELPYILRKSHRNGELGTNFEVASSLMMLDSPLSTVGINISIGFHLPPLHDLSHAQT